ncbi:MAG TPA: alpha/beta hydrolase [Natronosporangium sp.]|nr:alpha/beta hydrolase [Natronosporangium sp.]
MADPAPRDRRRRAGLLGALLGIGAAGVAIGVAAEKLLVRRARAYVDPHAGEEFGNAPYDEALTITTDQGLPLYVEVVNPVDGIAVEPQPELVGRPDPARQEPTLVFVHGFCLNMGVFHFQRKELARRGDWRAVFYDQPGHGRSGRLTDGEYALPELAGALRRVLDETTSGEPVVLIGHSMGGMTILAFAERYPEWFAQRVAGVVLISTSAGEVIGSGAALPELIKIGKPLLPLVNGATRVTGTVLDRARQASRQLARVLTQRYGFGGPNPSRALVCYVEEMNSGTPTETVARYLRTLYTHARYPVLESLRATPVLLICGDRDVVTPVAHSEKIKSYLPEAELLVVPDSGHMVLLEHHEVVTTALLDFLERLPREAA